MGAVTATSVPKATRQEMWLSSAESKARNGTASSPSTAGGAGQIMAATVQDGLEKEANRVLAKPAKHRIDSRHVKIARRTTGQTVTFGLWEWIYNPLGITTATMRQIEELSAKGEGPIQVIQWPAGEVVLTDGKWKDADD